ncbi:calcium-binding protein [Paracoccus sp. SCSIO 75233]|uniref:calcium-binding protein n=1 Tax=Paracoccus sp. SCSIO 75233 TaxID=3017782 RepID=UPI0022F03BF2|nr:calcium-binding protein [Paracoccus sp. SCSIO 75233]WBU53853.1 calcium-binding protein [Paracoccus sp. SCSIO 75233]
MAFNVITTSSHLGERLEGGQYSADWIDGLGGNDTIVGHDGADFLIGNTGDDQIFAGENDSDLDIVSGGDGNDTAYGGGGGDLMDGGAGSDYMGGGTGNDLMFGESGVRSFDPYAEKISQYTGNTGTQGPLASWLGLLDHVGIDDNYLNSFRQEESGNDTMWGNSGRDMIFGGWGDDLIGGGYGSDLLVGNRDNDTIYGYQGKDVVLGGDEDDLLFGGAGNDVIDGDETPRKGKLYNIDDKNVAPGNTEAPHLLVDYLDGLQWVSNDDNHNGDDEIYGGDGDDWIHGRAGADTIWGGTGNDTLRPGDDNETDTLGFIKGHGNDTIIGFDAGEWSEGGNRDWESREDLIDLSTANYGGEFQDAVDEGAIKFIYNVPGYAAAGGYVVIDTEKLGLEKDDDKSGANDEFITVYFESNQDFAAFNADNIALNGEQWVNITSGWQSLESLGNTSNPVLPENERYMEFADVEVTVQNHVAELTSNLVDYQNTLIEFANGLVRSC